jgi:hypothetical protein
VRGRWLVRPRRARCAIGRNVRAVRPFMASRLCDGVLALEALTTGEVTSCARVSDKKLIPQ